MHEWWKLDFKADFERQIFDKIFMAIFFTITVSARKEVVEEIFCHISMTELVFEIRPYA